MAMSEVDYLNLGKKELNVSYVTASWTSSGITIPTTKRAKAIFLLVNCGGWSCPFLQAFDSQPTMNNGTEDSTHRFTFSDNSIVCTAPNDFLDTSRWPNASCQCYILYD